MPWLGPIFAAVWASLYARFASDRSYLAGVFNQMRQTQVTGNEPDIVFMHLWQAGFIADALDLHLATHPLFGPFILRLLKDYYEQVGAKVDNFTHIGKDGRERLQNWLEDRFGSS